MNLTSFLQKMATDPNTIVDNFVTCFTGDMDYPFLFLTRFSALLKEKSTHTIESINFISDDYALIRSRLQTTFLGSTVVFKFCNFSSFESATDKTNFCSYLNGYQGPHNLIFFLSKETVQAKYNKNNWLVVELPEFVDYAIAQSFSCLFPQVQQAAFEPFIYKLFKRYQRLPLETVFLLLNYMAFVTAKNIDQFFTHVADYMVPDNQSLFALSQDLLARNSQSFFSKWATVADRYSAPFWVSFWSNQLWRAHVFVMLMESKDQTDAQGIAAKQLPFSFMQRDWQKYKGNTKLIDAHQHLFELDTALKTTGYPHALDLFLVRFFS